MSLDLGIETFTPLPWSHQGGEVPRYQPNLVVLRDCLCLCHEGRDDDFVIWQMKEIGTDECWTQLVKIPHWDWGMCSFTSLPLWLSENDNVLMFSFHGPQLSLRRPRSRFDAGRQRVPMTSQGLR